MPAEPPDGGIDAQPVVAVTGATGFIGRHLVPALAAAGYRPRLLVRRDPADIDWGGLDIELVPGDLGQPEALRCLLRGSSAVIHLAGLVKARRDAEFFAVNVEGTAALLDAFAAVAPEAHLVHVSSLAAREPTLSAYARSKREGEALALAHAPTRVSIVRPPAVYGPGDRETLAFFEMARLPLVPLLGGAQARMAVIHVVDLCAALATVAGMHPSKAVHALADAQPSGYGWREIMQAAGAAIGRESVPMVRLPRALLRGAGVVGDALRGLRGANMLTSGKVRELLHDDWAVSASELLRLPGASPHFGLRDGFADAVRGYRQLGWLPQQAA
jgi:nucleoside-diphosphate-sugar epimerase